jgi:hypothetical protein
MLKLDRAVKLLISLLFACLCFVSPLCAQTANPQPGEKCVLNVAQSPEIRGLRLGMSLDDTATKLPAIRGSDHDLNPDDMDVVFVSFIPRNGSFDLEGISWVHLGFVDDRLYDFSLSYTLSWPTIDEFALKLSRTLDLPTAWKKVGSDDLRVLECDGFSIAVHNAASPMLSVLETSAAEEVKRRALLPETQRLSEKKERQRRKLEAQEEKKRKTFRP